MHKILLKAIYAICWYTNLTVENNGEFCIFFQPAVFPLDDESFEHAVADDLTFVMFYAPW